MSSATKSTGQRPSRPARLSRFLMRMGISIGLSATLVGVLPPAPVHAQTITVTTTAESPGGTGDCTLGEAIQAANTNTAVDACPAGTADDTIVLQASATYSLSKYMPLPYSSPTAFVVTSTITLQGNGATLTPSTVGTTIRFFRVQHPADLTLSNLVLRDGLAVGVLWGGADHAKEFGGAIRHDDGTLTLDGVTFINNWVVGNYAGDRDTGGEAGGGAVYSAGPLFITPQGATFISNTAMGGPGGQSLFAFDIGGQGGAARGGALVALNPQFSADANIVAEDNVAQGGDGGAAWIAGNGGAAFGGAFFFGPGTHAVLTHSRFESNRAIGGGRSEWFASGTTSGGTASGGAIYSDGLVTLTHSIFSLNLARGGSSYAGGGAIGGGILLNGTGPAAGLTISSTLLLSNTAQGGTGTQANTLAGLASGGAIFVTGAPLNMSASAVVSNSAIQGTNPNTTTVANATGGGVVVASGMAAIVNTTFASNTARQGGGLYNGLFGGATTNLTHVTVYSNTAEAGGGFYNNSVVWLTNSLMASNAGDNCGGPGSTILQGENMQYPANSCGLATVTDPLLGALADHGGDTLTVDLLEKSPAINLADPAYCPATDQRGVARPSGAACDLGAFEYTPIEILILLWLPLVLR